jgi:hypothetical protein
MLQQCVEDKLSAKNTAQQLTSAGWPCGQKDVEELKRAHGVRKNWKGSDRELDEILDDLLSTGRIGDRDGYRRVTAVLQQHALIKPLTVGKNRVQLALARLAPAQVLAPY